MSSIWIIVDTSSQRIGHSLSGFDGDSPTKGRVRWNDGLEEDIRVSASLRKCILRSFEHYRYEYYPEFKLQLEQDLTGLVTYWLASKQITKTENEIPKRSESSVSASYSAGKDFITTLDGLTVDYDSKSITPQKINKILTEIVEMGLARIINEKPKVYEYCGPKPITAMWPGSNFGYQHSENIAKEFLEKKIASYFYAAENMNFGDVRSDAWRESNPLPIVDYALTIWGGGSFQGYTQSFLDKDQLEFLEQFGILFSVVSSYVRNDTHKKKIAAKLMRPLISDFSTRPISAGIYPGLSKAFQKYSQKIFDKEDYSGDFLDSKNAAAAKKFSEKEIVETQLRVLESGLLSKFPRDLIESLACIESIRLKTNQIPDLGFLQFEALEKIYFAIDENTLQFDDLGVRIVYFKILIENALLRKFELAEPSILMLSPFAEFLDRVSVKGILPETFSRNLFLVVARKSRKIATNPNWWLSLDLTQVASLVLENLWIKEILKDLEEEHNLITAKIPNHLTSSSKISDFIVLLQICDWLELDSASDLKQLWVKTYPKSALLFNLAENISEEPVRKTRLELNEKHEIEVKQEKKLHNALLQQVNQLSDEKKSLEVALKRGQEDTDRLRIGLEMSISRKFAEGVAKIIRRLERESGKKPFSEIISREAAGLLRLGIELLPAGELQPFSPSIHDSAGQTIQKDAPVLILETGVLLMYGNDKITVLKAVVKSAN